MRIRVVGVGMGPQHVTPEAAEATVGLLTGRGVPAWVAGTVADAGDRPGGGSAAELVGSYR